MRLRYTIPQWEKLITTTKNSRQLDLDAWFGPNPPEFTAEELRIFLGGVLGNEFDIGELRRNAANPVPTLIAA